MKKLLLSLAFCALALAAQAANTTKSVTQVTEAMSLTADVDLHITSDTPFTTTGSVDIVNTDHAVVIFERLRPSAAARQLGFITINGAPAVNGTNCQLRLYSKGTILYPYGREATTAKGFHPLAVYSEQYCKGDTCELFALEHSGGFMNTLSAAKLKKRIRSFRLKRGYMVTFSIQDAGRGYSRCFIAADADLVFNTLPKLLDKRICSYRVFRWSDPGKAGVADMLDTGKLKKLDATWSYTWGNGNDLGTDYECVPHMNHRWGPSAASMGSANYSCHIKTDNEPGNSADPEPATVDQVLARWEDLMRTGKRLMTPSSHDGSMGWFAQFLDSIDGRGWRCEVLDFHCYWTEGSYNNLKGYADRYGRPIWISEFVWGASWNSNGAFANGVTEAQNRDAMSRIWTNLNNWNWVERYAYWNGERDPSRILKYDNETKSDKLTPAGEYFASMKTGLGYKNYGSYVPKAPPMKNPSGLTVAFNQVSYVCTLSWQNNNNGLTDAAVVQKKDGSRWVNLDTLSSDVPNMTATIRMDAESARGLNTFRIMDIDYDSQRRYSAEASFFVGGAVAFGDVMAGTIESNNSDEATISFDQQDAAPIVVTGMPSFKNTSNGVVNHITAIGKSNFKFYFDPWTLKTAMTISKTESTDFLAMRAGSYEWGDMRALVDTCIYYNDRGVLSKMSQGDTIEVAFKEPFDEGVTPVVLVQNVCTEKNHPTSPKVFDITNKGFKMKLVQQAGMTSKPRLQYSYYIAITPGSAPLGDTGKKIYAGVADNLTGGSLNVESFFRSPEGDTLFFRSPYIIAGAQTHNLDVASVMRKYGNISKEITNADGNTEVVTYGIRVRRQVDTSASIPAGSNTAAKTGDYIGWIVIADANDQGVVGIGDLTGETTKRAARTATIYDLSGRPVGTNPATLKPGIYVRDNKKVRVE